MGDISDYYADLEMLYQFKSEQNDEYYYNIHFSDLLKEYIKGKLCWITKNNQKVLIKDMSDSHLINSINFINKYHSDRTVMQELRDILIIEKEKRKL